MSPIVLLDEANAAELLKVSSKTLERFRQTGMGPKFTKIGRRVLYLESDLIDWLQAQSFRSTAEYGNRKHRA